MHHKKTGTSTARAMPITHKCSDITEDNACCVCWTISWAPIPDNYDCKGINTLKKGNNKFICEYCKLQQQYTELLRRYNERRT